MPIAPQFTYKNEAEFTNQFLVPLLRRLGFSVVAAYHSTQEFGKDLVFGEVDRFGQVVYHGLQAKYVASVSQRDSHGLIADCREAFDNPFHHPGTGAEERISTFVVANGGSITLNARKNFFNALSTPHGGQIKMLDGNALVELDRWATIRQTDSASEYLSGLLLEVRYNARLGLKIRSMLEAYLRDDSCPLPVERLRCTATSHYLTRPFMASHIDTSVVSDYWHLVSNNINAALESITMGMGPSESKLRLAKDLLPIIDRATKIAVAIDIAVEPVLERLGPLTDV